MVGGITIAGSLGERRDVVGELGAQSQRNYYAARRSYYRLGLHAYLNCGAGNRLRTL